MPRVFDPGAIRAILETDRVWSVYMLADLEPPYWQHTEWHAPRGSEPAIVLLYRGLHIPVLSTLGTAGALAELLGEIGREERMYLSVQAPVPALLRRAGYEIRDQHRMLRMALDPARFRPPRDSAARLGPADLDAIRELYRDGEAESETPPFFDASMLEHGLYYGVWEDGRLAAACGTHVLAAAESAAALGNIYTRRDRRGSGFATRVTTAATGELVRRGIRTVALNVAADNAPALRIYERLGFVRYCDYFEAVAVRSSAPAR